MADAVHGLVVGRPLVFANEERMAIHSWSRITSAGHSVLLDALKILSPMSHDFSSTEELVTFLQELSAEGHQPTVLRSKDVYRYRSCTSQPLTEDMLKASSRSLRPSAKRRGKRTITKKVHPSWNNSEKSSPRIQGIRPPELLVDHRTVACIRKQSRTEETLQTLQTLQPCLRLTNIEGRTGFHTARLQIHTIWDSTSEAPSVAFSKQQHPPTRSGIPLQPSQNGGGAPTKAVALFSQKKLSCPVRHDGALIGDSAPVFYANGRVFPQTHTELTSNGWKRNGLHQDCSDPKEVSTSACQKSGCPDKNCIRWKVIKVDDSRSVAEARRKAQKILQVNLSPVIQIQPLNHVLRDYRHQTN